MTAAVAAGTGVVRGTALGLLAVTVGAGLLVQFARAQAWSDPAGTVLYVVAAALLIMVVRPGWPPWLLAALAGTASIAVELGQLRGGPAEWVPRSGPLRLLLGSTFTVADLGWLVAGTAVAWLVVRIVSLGRRDHTRRPTWQAGLAVSVAGVGVMLFGSWLGWLAGIGRRLPGLVEWAPIVAGVAVLLAGAMDTWRGLSRDDRTPDPESLGRRLAVGLLLAVPAVMVVALVVDTAGRGGPLLVAVVVAAGLGVAIMMSVVAGWGDGVPQRGRVVVGAVTSLAVVILGVGIAGPTGADRARTAPTTPPPVLSRPATTAVPTAVPSRVPSRVSTAPEASDGVGLCRVEQLTARTQGWDAAMGDTAVTVVVSNMGGRDCAVRGLPSVSLLQGRSPVALQIDHESIDRPGEVDRPRRALVRAGGQVRVLLRWDGYRSQADGRTTQALTLHAPGVGSVPVELDQGPAPFDLVDGGRVSVSGWK